MIAGTAPTRDDVSETYFEMSLQYIKIHEYMHIVTSRKYGSFTLGIMIIFYL